MRPSLESGREAEVKRDAAVDAAVAHAEQRCALRMGFTGTSGARNGIPVYRYTGLKRCTGIPVTQTSEAPFSSEWKAGLAERHL